MDDLENNIVNRARGWVEVNFSPESISKSPVVSVCVQTYQHEKFIEQCLHGIVSQQTNFEFEIVLGEDQSKDETRKKCIEFAKRHPDLIRLILHDRSNQIYINGSPTGRFNFMNNMANCRGKYIAVCEGDDYWLDPHKLQKQVDYLESHPELAMCFHNAMMVNEQDSRRESSSTYLMSILIRYILSIVEE